MLNIRETQLSLADLPNNGMKSIQDVIHKNIKSLNENAEIIQPNMTNSCELKLTSNSEFLQVISRQELDKYTERKESKSDSLQSRVAYEEEDGVESAETNENLTATQKLKNEYLMLKNSRAVGQKPAEKYKEAEKHLKSVQFNAEMLAYVDVCSRSPELVRSSFN